MKNFCRDHWPLLIIVPVVSLMALAAIHSGNKFDATISRQKILDAELKLQAVRTGLGEFYVSTNTATIEFRLKPTP